MSSFDGSFNRLCVDEPARTCLEHVRLDTNLICVCHTTTEEGELCRDGCTISFDQQQLELVLCMELHCRFAQKAAKCWAGKATRLTDALLSPLVQVHEGGPECLELFCAVHL